MLVEGLRAAYRLNQLLYCLKDIADGVTASSDTKLSVKVKCKFDDMSTCQCLPCVSKQRLTVWLD